MLTYWIIGILCFVGVCIYACFVAASKDDEQSGRD